MHKAGLERVIRVIIRKRAYARRKHHNSENFDRWYSVVLLYIHCHFREGGIPVERDASPHASKKRHGDSMA